MNIFIAARPSVTLSTATCEIGYQVLHDAMSQYKRRWYCNHALYIPSLLFIPDMFLHSYKDLVDSHLCYFDIDLRRNLHCNCTETHSLDPMIQKINVRMHVCMQEY
jgi:hypothetical protein